MTVPELAKRLETHRTQFVVEGEEYDGSCPCSSGVIKVDGHKVFVHTQCWRVSHNENGEQELMVATDHPKAKEIAELFKAELDSQEWYNPYHITLEGGE